MRKIPTLFRRDPDNKRRVLPEVHPDCQWVLDGEGIATRKYDGTCVMFDGTTWWARREVKEGKTPPPGFWAIDRDDFTGKTVGWESVEQSPFAKFHAEAFENMPAPVSGGWKVGTYELVGPRINGNPEETNRHYLWLHDIADEHPDAPRDFDGLKEWLTDFHGEGLVWHHPDGRMAKLKRRDFQ